MKTRNLFIIPLLFVSLTISIYGQNTKSKVPTKTVTTKAEIDRLAEKYKNNSSVTLYTSHGELDGAVEIENNPDDKPQLIRITGMSENKAAIEEFLAEIISQKKKQGYKITGNNGMPDDMFSIGNDWDDYNNTKTFKKGTMYFIAKGGFASDVDCSIYDEMRRLSLHRSCYHFSIETGDNSRKGGKNATKFDF